MNAKSARSLRYAKAARWTIVVAAALAGCGLQACRGRSAPATAARTTRLIPGSVAASFTSVPFPPSPPADPAIYLVYAEPLPRTLATAVVSLPAGTQPLVEAAALDRIAEGADASPDFGSHAYARFGSMEYLAYLDRSADGRLALKQLQRRAGDETWNVDLLEPASRPSSFLSRGSAVSLVLADPAGLLEQALAPRRLPQRRIYDGGPLARPPSVVRGAAGDILVAVDGNAGRILIAGWEGQGLAVSAASPPPDVTLGGPYHARVDAEGRLRLFLYDGASQELLDVVDPGGQSGVTRVTRAMDVTAVAAFTDGPDTLYLYAETVRTPAGAQEYSLSLLRTRPGASGSAAYRRIDASPAPFVSIQAHIAEGELRVVALTDGLTLIRLALEGN